MTDYDVDTFELSDIWFRSLAYPIEARLDMIRQHYLTQINDMIAEEAEGRFKETDFSLLLKNDEDFHILEITYLYEPSYRFIAKMKLTDDDVITGNVYITITASPGNKFVKETAVNVRVHELDDYIKAWLGRVDEELSSIPLQRQLEEQRQEIEHIFEQLGEIPKDYFSKQDADLLRDRLDDLEARLTQNLQDTIADQTELQTQLDEITSDMSVLKENIDILNKRGWVKSFVTRTVEWAQNPANAKLLKSGVEVAKNLLLPEGDPPPK